MTIRRRRTLDLAVALGFLLVLGVLAVVGVVVGDNERVTRFWTRAQVTTDGNAGITESIDYAFGPVASHHGIERWVPGLPNDAPVTVDSRAPSGVQLIPEVRDG